LLRTRIGANGMDYKGYNIAVHEFGHNVEQTISLHDVDYYSLNRVPNTSFTEALAFIFQKRDLELLGLSGGDPMKEHMNALANFWSCYEIMGVSLVDMEVWKWMYANPNATPEELKEAVITIAKDIWNKYYAPVFGQKDEPILAIYSHMISNPLYLSNYPLGHLIDFQIEQYIADKNFADEILRIYKLGSIIPQQWMKEAVGQPLSTQPTIEAAEMALEVIGNN
jgi:oligoendopeptidase F